MDTQTATTVCFSPTGTTHRILRGITRGMRVAETQMIDLTLPRHRAQSLPSVDGDVLILGMPVYEERVPFFIAPLLEQLSGRGQPAVVVSTYGNVGFGITLHQMADTVTRKGFHLMGGATFIGEHSFAHDALPVAMGRPDQEDMAAAEGFGGQIVKRLAPVTDPDQLTPPVFPGHLPLMARILPENSSSRFTYPPSADEERCTGCGVCAAVCPRGAIEPQSWRIDESLCVRCFACVRRCPAAARRIALKKGPLVRRILRSATIRRQEPQFYF